VSVSSTAVPVSELPATTSPTGPALTTWVLSDVAKTSISMRIPPDFKIDPRLQPLSAVDATNGLMLLQRWIVPKNGHIAAISVQVDPGDAAPVNKLIAYRTIATQMAQWAVVDLDPGEATNIVAFARVKGYLIEITAPDDVLAAQLVNTVSLVGTGATP
jgi:hypothetical protein